ncbi:hypothetical protein KVT40_001897 [Elsinoe batatas]|uniref:Uncharacterized protein n=1 Tax=Elsinoe batatas TaxID=2601811 RepID=A0A8K0LDM2_9PEZI|nr:hypothetical protein KVT40_001897 [Elsinoe batatas]
MTHVSHQFFMQRHSGPRTWNHCHTPRARPWSSRWIVTRSSSVGLYVAAFVFADIYCGSFIVSKSSIPRRCDECSNERAIIEHRISVPSTHYECFSIGHEKGFQKRLQGTSISEKGTWHIGLASVSIGCFFGFGTPRINGPSLFTVFAQINLNLPSYRTGSRLTSLQTRGNILQNLFSFFWHVVVGGTMNITRSAIVTGSGRGIGKAVALRLARDGYSVCVNDVSAQRDAVNSVVDEIRALKGNAIGVIADVTKVAEVEDLVQRAGKAHGPLHLLIANAGIIRANALLDVTQDDWNQLFDVNARGIFNSYTIAARTMIKQGRGGKIVGAASIASFKPFPMTVAYSATKAVVRSLTQGAALEWAKYGITVNAFAPGIVRTDMWDQIDGRMAEEHGGEKGNMIDLYSKRMSAMKRPSEPSDVADMVSFFGSPDSNHVTGQTFVVDGGIWLN